MLSKLCPAPQSTQQVDATYHYFKGNIGNKTFHPCVLRMHWWLSGRASDLRSSSRGFEARPRRCCVTTLGKLFTPYCLCHQSRGAPTRITWFRSVRWCLAVGLACGDQRRLTGSGSALEVVLQDYALYKSTFTLLYCSLHHRFLTNFSAHKLLIKFDVPFASALKSTLTAIHLEAVSQLRRGWVTGKLTGGEPSINCPRSRSILKVLLTKHGYKQCNEHLQDWQTSYNFSTSSSPELNF